MSDVLSLAQQLEQDLANQREQIDNLKKGLDLRVAKVKKREKDADEREKQLAEWEKALNAKYEEVSRIENAKLLEVKAQDFNVKAEARMKEVHKEREQLTKMLTEINFREGELLKREQAVTEREKSYRDKIKQETVEALFKNLSK